MCVCHDIHAASMQRHSTLLLPYVAPAVLTALSCEQQKQQQGSETLGPPLANPRPTLAYLVHWMPLQRWVLHNGSC